PTWGARPLVILGGALIFAVVAFRFSDTHRQEFQIRHALVEQTALRGKRLEQATQEILLRSTAGPGRQAGFAERATRAANKVMEQPPFAEDAPKAPAGPPGVRRAAMPYVQVPPRDATPPRGPVWPVLLAGAAFLYLWWLAALLLDLFVAWQH